MVAKYSAAQVLEFPAKPKSSGPQGYSSRPFSRAKVYLRLEH